MAKSILNDRFLMGSVLLLILLCIAVGAIVAQGMNSGKAGGKADVPPVQENVTLISWFGAVTDTYGKPFGGLPVTLHIMGFDSHNQAYEIYNHSTTTLVDPPYPGSYVFDNVVLTPEASFGYVTVRGNVGDEVTYHGRSNNYSFLNMSRISTGFVVLHVPMPDAVTLTLNPDSITAGGSTTAATAQLMLNGKPYVRSGVEISFASENDLIVHMPEVTRILTDNQGKAQIRLTSGVATGDVNVSAFNKVSMSRNLTNSSTLHVVA